MGNRPQKPPSLRFHKIADPDDPAWDRWYEHGHIGQPARIGHLSGMITLRPDLDGLQSVEGVTLQISKEYKKIADWLLDLRKQHDKYSIARRAVELDATTTDRFGEEAKVRNHEKIAEELTKEFDFPICKSYVTRVLSEWSNKNLSGWYKGDTHGSTWRDDSPSTVGPEWSWPGAKPRPDSD